MKVWRLSLLIVILVAHLTAEAAADESGLCESTDNDGTCKGSARDTLFVDGAKLQAQIDELAAFSDTPTPTVTRILYTPNDVAARRFVPQLNLILCIRFSDFNFLPAFQIELCQVNTGL